MKLNNGILYSCFSYFQILLLESMSKKTHFLKVFCDAATLPCGFSALDLLFSVVTRLSLEI